jgi:uncharacterized protein with PIN domain
LAWEKAINSSSEKGLHGQCRLAFVWMPTAGLNFGGCITYALAREKREPVLWKGDDFGHTDLRAAV